MKFSLTAHSRKDNDLLNNAPRKAVALGTFGLIDRLQGYGVPIRVLATACLFLMVCRTYKMNPADILGKANNIMADDHGADAHEFRAGADFLKRFQWRDGQGRTL